METTAAFSGLVCTDCAERFAPGDAAHRCPDCEGVLAPDYDLDAVDLDRATLAERPFSGMWRYEELLPFPRETAVTMAEGATPVVDCPKLADELGVGRVVIKDEGRNPTGTSTDRGQAVAVTAASQHGATDVALATTGDAGQAAAAYAARAGLDSHVVVPSRANFVTKAMINVHGGDMYVVEGRITDAAATYEELLAENDDWYPVGAFATPYRHEGEKTTYYELAEQLDWTVPDHVVYPTGEGVGLVGMYRAACEFRDLGLVDDTPAFYAAQAAGCAPIVEAFDEGRERHEPWEVPDTICGGIEVPDPGASHLVLEALRESGGGAVATDDETILDSAVTVAQHEGVETGVTAAAAAAGAWELAQRGAFEPDDTVVIFNTDTGNKDADVVRSRLMAQGV